MRASVTDRDRVIEVVKASFVEGRLAKAELDLRVEQALVSGYFPELMTLIADLPVGPFGRLPWHRADPAPPRTSRLAAAALARCLTRQPAARGRSPLPAAR